MPLFKKPVVTINTSENSYFSEKNNSKGKAINRESFHQDMYLPEQSGYYKSQQTVVNFSKNISKDSTKFSDDQCRVCLEKGSIPIFGEIKKLPDFIVTIGGVEIVECDPYPKYLCLNCHKLLLSGVLFRATAQKTDKLLRETIESEQESVEINDVESHVSDMSDDEDLNEVLKQHLISHTDCHSTIVTKESRDLIDSTELNKNMVENDSVNIQKRNSKENLNHCTTDMLKLPIKQIKVKFLKPVGHLQDFNNRHNNNILQELNPTLPNMPLDPESEYEKIICIQNAYRHNIKSTSKDSLDQIVNSIFLKLPEVKWSKAKITPTELSLPECTNSLPENSNIIKVVMNENGNFTCNDSGYIKEISSPNSKVRERDNMSDTSEKPSKDDDYSEIVNSVFQKLPEVTLSKAKIIPTELPQECIDSVSENSKVTKVVMTENGNFTCNDFGDLKEKSSPNSKVIERDNMSNISENPSKVDDYIEIVNSVFQKLPEVTLSKAKISPTNLLAQECTNSVSENTNTIKFVVIKNGNDTGNDSGDIKNKLSPNSEVRERDNMSEISETLSEDDDYVEITNTAFQKLPEVTLSNPNSEVIERDNINDLSEKSSEDDDYFGDKVPPEKNILTTTWTCDDCGLQYKYYKGYLNHTIKNHPARKKKKCTVCQKMYSIKNIKRHVSYHKKGSVCEFCGKQFIGNAFRIHLQTHKTDLPFKCSLCPYRGRNMEYVKHHIKSRHEKVKQYKCPECPEQFINPGNLNRHINKHRGVRPFKCDICNKGFYCKFELKKHRQHVHFGTKKRTICRFCGKNFSNHKKRLDHECHEHKMIKKYSRLPLYIQFDITKRQKELSGNILC